MSKQVKGFLASDGKFFERDPECKRHEALINLEALCDSHGTSFENFLICLNAWQKLIKDYFNANDKCKEPFKGSGEIHFVNGSSDDDHTAELDESFSRVEGDTPDPTGGDKDAPGFLEQSFRKYK